MFITYASLTLDIRLYLSYFDILTKVLIMSDLEAFSILNENPKQVEEVTQRQSYNCMHFLTVDI